ncbi:MAG: DUF7674 family protein [Candidatus Dormibacteria bacterium]
MPNAEEAVSPVISRLLAACPDLESYWQAERNRLDAGLPYSQVAALARAIVVAHSGGVARCISELFDEAESTLSEGNSEERALMVVGLLEDTQGALRWARLDPAPLYEMLGPRCRAAWDSVLALWSEIAQKKQSGELPPGPFDAGESDISDPELRRIFRATYRPPEP